MISQRHFFMIRNVALQAECVPAEKLKNCARILCTHAVKGLNQVLAQFSTISTGFAGDGNINRWLS